MMGRRRGFEKNGEVRGNGRLGKEYPPRKTVKLQLLIAASPSDSIQP